MENISDKPVLHSYNSSTVNESTDIFDGVFGEFDISERARIILSRPQHAIALILGTVSIGINLCSLLALTQVRNRLTTHFRLIISLSLSDILVGTSVLMYIINKIVNPAYIVGIGNRSDRLRSRCMFIFIKALNNTGLNVSLLNLMGMSLDHYVAITRPLHYPKLLCKEKARVMIVILWAIAILCGTSDLFSAIPHYHALKEQYNFCEIVWITGYQEEFTVFAMAGTCFITMMFIYVKIYLVVRKHKSPGESNLKQEVQRNKRALCTTLLILGSFVACWLPCCLYQLTMVIKMKVDPLNLDKMPKQLLYILSILDKYFFDLLLVNCVCDPIIYTVRTFEVKLGYRRLFRRCFRSTSKYPPYSFTALHFNRSQSQQKQWSCGSMIYGDNLAVERMGNSHTHIRAAKSCKKTEDHCKEDVTYESFV